MRHGYHMGLGFYGSYILIFLLLIISVLIFLVLKSQSPVSPFVMKLINILKEKYASGILTADEFIERKSIIEDTEYSNSYTPILLERYAKCVINTKEFLNIKNEIESNKNDVFICEQLAKGDLSYDEFKSKMIGG
jgi:uncharacterized membrane protein